MSNQDRRRLKRKRKQQQLHRLKSASAVRAISLASGQFGCYATRDWRQQGIASILVVKTLPSGRHVLGAYLVDLWCCGLKDTWGRLDITSEELDDALASSEAKGAGMEDISLDLVREIVAGGIRFARQNSFRLPHRYERWVALIGVNPATAEHEADLNLFGINEGGKKLHYIGPVDDLQKRLIGMTAEEFLARPDVQYIVGAGLLEDQDWETDEPQQDQDESDEVLEDIRQQLHGKLLEKVRQWCFANHQSPHPALPEAIDTMMESLAQVRGSADTDPDETQLGDESARLFEQALLMYGPQKRDELAPAVAQLSEWMNTFDSSQELFAAMGLEDEPE